MKTCSWGIFLLSMLATLSAFQSPHADANPPGAPAAANPATPHASRPEFGVLYSVWIRPGDSLATVRIRLTRNADWVRWLRLEAPADRYTAVKGSGTVTREGTQIVWQPSGDRPALQYTVNLQSVRQSGRFDGMVTPDWGIFRADDIAPVVRVDVKDGTQSLAKLSLNLPDGWSAVTAYPEYTSGRIRIDNPRRIFDRPSGWMAIGHLGVKRERVGDTRLAIAAPKAQGVARMDILAFFRWTLPTLQSLFPEFPERLLVVSAGDPMWRGALSGPNSLFVHADRPLISENGTSTFLHELVHVAMRARSRPDSDWIVEGMAEYYSLEVLHRSGALSDARFEKAHASLAKWGTEAPKLDVPHSSGPVTAKAVGVLRAIDRDIRSASKGRKSLDDVARALAATDEPVTRARFDALVARARKGL